MTLRRQLAFIAGSHSEAALCWLRLAKLCRITGHYDSAMGAVLAALGAHVPGAKIERAKLLWAEGKHPRAILELQQVSSNLAWIVDVCWRCRDYLTPAVPSQVHQQYQNGKEVNPQDKAKVLLRLAQWTAETGQGGKEEVKHLFKAALACRAWEKGHFSYAVYLDKLMNDAKQRQVTGDDDRLKNTSRLQLGI